MNRGGNVHKGSVLSARVWRRNPLYTRNDFRGPMILRKMKPPVLFQYFFSRTITTYNNIYTMFYVVQFTTANIIYLFLIISYARG